jgi:two-component system response regulator HydG
MGTSVRILVVDDEQHVRESLAAWFREDGYEVNVAASGREALAILAHDGADILLVDIKMPAMDGLELHRRVRELAPDATVIIMTAYASVETAVQALKDGAYDYVVKPFDPDAVSRLVRKAAERYSLMKENRALRERLESAAPALITAGQGRMREVQELLERVAPTDTSVLITGESGTGKELVARLLHAQSSRRFGPFAVVNCGALAEGVLESELFGHERGAFTGAVARHRGKIELAHEGTLFLDEIGDVPARVQVSLLRVLQERTLTRVGGTATIPVDFRLVTATHRDLEAEVSSGRFREDFFFRINVFHIHVPALRERSEDVPMLAEHFLAQFSRQMNRRIEGFTPEAIAALCAYPWPGNVRELQNAIERAVVMCRGATIDAGLFPFAHAPAAQDLSLDAMEAAHIRRVLTGSGFNVTQAAGALGIDRVTLYNKMKKYGIERP